MLRQVLTVSGLTRRRKNYRKDGGPGIRRELRAADSRTNALINLLNLRRSVATEGRALDAN